MSRGTTTRSRLPDRTRLSDTTLAYPRQSRSIPPPKAIRHSKERPPHQPGPFTRGHSTRAKPACPRRMTIPRLPFLRNACRCSGGMADRWAGDGRRRRKNGPCGHWDSSWPSGALVIVSLASPEQPRAAMTKAHKFSASRVAVFPNVPTSQVEWASSLACLSSSMSESTLSSFLIRSRISMHFSVVCFRQFSMLPDEMSFDLGFSVVHTRQLRQVVCQLISHSRHCLFEPSKLSLLTCVTHAV